LRAETMFDSELKALLTGRDAGTPSARIVRVLSERGALSPGELARLTGLAKSTVSTTLAELRKSAVIIDHAANDIGRSQVGRPPTRVVLNPVGGTCVGLCIGLNYIQVIVADVSHAVLSDHRSPLPTDYSPAKAAEVTRALAQEAYAEAGLSQENLLGVGVAVAGPVDPVSGQVMRASGVPTWAGTDIRSLFEPIFRRPIFADNESNCAAIAEMMWGAAVGEEDFVFFKLEVEGIGGAIVARGRVIAGAHGAGGEFGHITVDPMGDLCRCGNRGCLEVHASFRRALAHAETRFGRPTTADEVIGLAVAGDIGCRRLIADAAEAAGRGLGVIGSIIDPGLIVVGGRVARAGDVLLESLAASYDRHTLVKRADLAPASRTRFVTGTLLDNDSCLGGVGLVLRHHGRLA
jgi:predicted NBD/HSP70 family sugar kinase